MNAYTNITDNYHSGVVIAPDLERAREVFLRDAARRGFVPSESNVLTTDPDVSYRIEAADERLFLFPDAGCC